MQANEGQVKWPLLHGPATSGAPSWHRVSRITPAQKRKTRQVRGGWALATPLYRAHTERWKLRSSYTREQPLLGGRAQTARDPIHLFLRPPAYPLPQERCHNKIREHRATPGTCMTREKKRVPGPLDPVPSHIAVHRTKENKGRPVSGRKNWGAGKRNTEMKGPRMSRFPPVTLSLLGSR